MTKIGIYNHETGEQEVRDMTAEELAELEAEQVIAEAKAAEREAALIAKNAILDRLGLTESEAQLLGLIPTPPPVISE
jgi:hypothetical protein